MKSRVAPGALSVESCGNKPASPLQLSGKDVLGQNGQNVLGRRSSLGRTVNRKVFQRGRRDGNVKQSYEWDDSSALGEGAFGKVFKAKSRHDPKKVVAVKQVNKSACEDLDELWKEIGILEAIDHPHTLRFLEAYEDYRCIYIVTELCMGGDLMKFLHKICGDVAFASRMTSEVLNALAFCHGRGICHRDLKLDNILLLRASKDSPVRVADFGLASQLQESKCKEQVKHAHEYAERIKRKGATATNGSLDATGRKSQRLTSFKGTPEYMAPEVLAVLNAKINSTGEFRFYDFRCDVWSLGVVVSAVLNGREPYTLEDVAAYVENNSPLPKRKASDSQNAELFVERCLCANYEERPASNELLEDTFLRDWEQVIKRDDTAASQVFTEINDFMQCSHVKRAALTAAAKHLGPFEQEELRRLFEAIDVNKTGTITLQELRSGVHSQQNHLLGRLGSPLIDTDWVIRAFAAMDTDLSGEVDYVEFLAAVMSSKIEERQDLAWASFRAFDMDGNGKISKHELANVLDDPELQKMLEEVATESQQLRSHTDGSDSMPASPAGIPCTPCTPSTMKKLAEQSFHSRGVDGIMAVADKDQDGDLSFEEFVDLLKLG